MKNLHDTGNGVTDPDMQTLVEKDKKITNDLVSLTEEVKELSRRLGHTFGESSPLVSGKVKTQTVLPGNLPDGIVDFVISASVSQPAFSAVLIGEFLKSEGIHVATLTQKHSSLSGEIPDDFLAVSGGLGGRLQHDVEKLVFTFLWKDEPFCPSLMISTQLQTKIIGDANIGRHLCRILCPQLYNEDDIDISADIDKWIDASVQMNNGNSKEKDSALKSMNSHLGRNNYFCGETITLADITILASLLANSNYVKSLPKNVKKWFLNVSSCFKNSLARFNLPSAWTAQ